MNDHNKREGKEGFYIFIALVVGILLTVFTEKCHAQGDQIVIDAGLGILNSEGSSLSQNKFAKIGVEEDLWYNLKQKINVGEWLDNRGYGYSNSAFTGYQLGFEVSNEVLEASVWSGPTLIGAPDAALGGPIQFNETIYLGIVDKDKNSIGMVYNHFSSAGIYVPNLGRDYLGLEIKWPF